MSHFLHKNLLSPEGFREDGRRKHELRELDCRIGELCSRANGSSLVRMGSTKVMSYVFGPTFDNKSSQGKPPSVQCYFTPAPFSTTIRRHKHARMNASLAASATLSRIFQAAVITEKYSQCQILIRIYVIQNDGGALGAAINATTLALINACIYMRDFVSSCTVGLISGNQVFVDLNNTEAEAADAELTVAIYSKTQEVVAVEMFSKISFELFSQVQASAVEASVEIAKHLKDSIQDHTKNIHFHLLA